MIITNPDVLKELPLGEKRSHMEAQEQKSTTSNSSKHACSLRGLHQILNIATVSLLFPSYVNDGRSETSTFRIEKRRKKVRVRAGTPICISWAQT